MKVSRTAYTNTNGKWEILFKETDRTKVYEWLSSDLVAHYVHKASRIAKVTDMNNFDGTRTIRVYYSKEWHLMNEYVVDVCC